MKRPRNIKANTDPFFAEMEQQKFHSGACCSVVSVVWLFVLAIMLGAGAIWFLLNPVKRAVNESSSSGANSYSIFQSLFSPQKNQSDTTTYTVRVRDSDLTEVVRQSNLPNMHDVESHIHPAHIELKGTFERSPARLSLLVVFVPKVNKTGDISIEVKDAVVGGIRALPIMTTGVRQQISQALQGFIQNKFPGRIVALELKEGEMTALVEPK